MKPRLLGALAAALLAATVLASIPLATQAAHSGGTHPEIDSATFLDGDDDGFLDAVEIVFDADMNANTLRAGDFRINDVPAHNITAGAGARTFTLAFPPGLNPDTDDLPKLEYVRGTARDAANANNVLEGVVVAAAAKGDGAAPLLLGASAQAGDTTIVLSFSEPVENVTSDPPGVTDFCYVDGGNTTQVITSVSTIDRITLTMNGPLEPEDVDATPATVAAGTCGTSPSTIQDSNGNPADPDAVPLRTPAIESVQGDTNSTRLIVRFNMPVQGLSQGDFVLTLSGPSPPTLSGIVHSDGSPIAQLTLSAPLAQSHIGSGNTLGANAGAVGAHGDGDNTAEATAVAILDGRGPRITGLDSVDGNDDGVFDAIRLTFDEAVGDVGAHARWRVHNGLTEVDVNAVERGNSGCASNFDAEEQVVYLCIDPDMHAGVLAAVSYTPGANDLEDLEENGLEAFEHRIAQDGIPPRIMTVIGTIGSDKLTVTFNEPVKGSSAQLAKGDFGFNGTAAIKDSGGVVHVAGTSTAQITLTQGLTHAQFSDTLAAKATVKDLNEELPANPQAEVSITHVKDTTAPGAITSLALVSIGSTGTTVTLNWTAPADNGTTVASGKVTGYEIRYNTTSAITASSWSSSTVATATFNPASLAAPGGLQNATVSGLSTGATYHFAVRAFDEGNNLGIISNVVAAPTDITAPGAVTGLAVNGTTVVSATLKWTAPADDGTTVASGKVTGYQVRYNTTGAITSGTVANAAAVASGNLTFNPALLAAPGSSQEATIAGLLPETEHFFAVRAVDEAGNAGPWAFSAGATTLDDPSPPAGQLVVESDSHASPSAATTVEFSWSGVTDPQSPVVYQYALTRDATHTFSGTDATTTDDNVTLQAGVGTWVFHISATSHGGTGDNASLAVHVKPARSLEDINKDLQGTLKVTRDGGDAVLSWDLGKVTPTPQGIQLWRSTSPFQIIATLSGDALDDPYVDRDAPDGSAYIISAFYGNHTQLGLFGSSAGLADVPGYLGFTEAQGREAAIVAPDAEGLPMWAWATIAVVAVLVMAGIVIAIVLVARKRRQKDDGQIPWESGQQDEEVSAWEADSQGDWHGGQEDWQDAAGQTFYLKCPRCAHDFTATGTRPLQTTCPSCQVRGVLH